MSDAGEPRGDGDERNDADEPMTVREERRPDGRTIVFFTFGDGDV